MKTHSENPPATFILITYNQEDYIEEAVLSAFSQIYHPLEIIISDDCSTDSTYEVICRLANQYEGQHTIRVNRNNKNMGISDHIRKLHGLASGEYLVHAAGDDISFPHRTSRAVHAFQNDPLTLMLFSNSLVVNQKGLHIEIMRDDPDLSIESDNPISLSLPSIIGSTVAITRQLVESFDDPIPTLIAEDVVLYRRALLLGRVRYLSEPLVKYRLNSGGISQSSQKSHRGFVRSMRDWSRDQSLRIVQLLLDSGKISKRLNAETIIQIKSDFSIFQLREALYSSGLIRILVAYIGLIFSAPHGVKSIPRLTDELLVRLLEPYYLLRTANARAKSRALQTTPCD